MERRETPCRSEETKTDRGRIRRRCRGEEHSETEKERGGEKEGRNTVRQRERERWRKRGEKHSETEAG